MGLPLILIAVLPLVVFAPLALLYGVFYVHDVQHYFYPYHVVSANIVADGHLPLWNPYAFSGMPLIGDGQTAIFYPPNWLFFIAPGHLALNYAILLQFSIAGVGTYLLARSLGLQLLPSFVAAIAYMFSGFLTARSVHLSIQSGAALVPLVFFTVERALRPGASLRWFAAAAVTLGLQSVTGHPQVPIYTALALGVFVAVIAITRATGDRDWQWLYRLPLRLAAMYALGYALAAVQLAPWVELGRLSPRAASADFEFVFEGSMFGGQWLLFFFPYLYGSLEPGFYGTGLGVEGITQLWEHSAYVGILTLGLAIIGAGGALGRLNPQRVYVLAFVLVLIGAVLMAAGNNTPFGELIYVTPLVGKLRQVERSLALADLALVMLAGFGLERLLTRRAEKNDAICWSAVVAAAVLVAIPVGVLVLKHYPDYQHVFAFESSDFNYIQLTRPNAYIPLTLAVSSAALLLWWSRRPPGVRTEILAAGLLLVDLTVFAAPFNPVAEPGLYDRIPESVEFIRNHGGLYRKITFLPSAWLDTHRAQDLTAVSWGMTYGLEDVNGFNSLQTRRYTDYLFSPHDDDVSYGQWADERLLRAGNPILSSLNVRYVLIPARLQPLVGPQFWQVFEDESVRIYENTEVYPRAFFAEHVTHEPDARRVLRTVTASGFNGQRMAVIEAAEPPPLSPSPTNMSDVLITRYGPNDIALETTTDVPRFLVLSEMYFPGWSAYVDGNETEIYRTNYLFRGIMVPSGTHKVTFAYRPVSVIAGAGMSAAALVVIGAMLSVSSSKFKVQRHQVELSASS